MSPSPPGSLPPLPQPPAARQRAQPQRHASPRVHHVIHERRSTRVEGGGRTRYFLVSGRTYPGCVQSVGD